MAEAFSTTSRRTLLGRMAAAPVMGVTATMTVAADETAGLMPLWKKRQRISAAKHRLDESADEFEYWSLDGEMNALDELIVDTPSLNEDDIRAKIAFLRKWHGRRYLPDQGERATVKLLADIERLFLAGGAA
jgi:hypothetical protein